MGVSCEQSLHVEEKQNARREEQPVETRAEEPEKNREMIDSGLVDSTEGYHESRRCSRDTHPESYIFSSILVYEE